MTLKRFKNPFEILGIHRSGLIKLNHEQVKVVINAMYRSLSRYWHPDAQSGDIKRFKEINEAYSTLMEDQEMFQFWLSSLRSGGAKHRKGLQERVEYLSEVKNQLEKRLVEFWLLREGKKISGIFHNGKLRDFFGLTNDLNPPYLMISHADSQKCFPLEKVEVESSDLIPKTAIWPQFKARKPYYWQKKPKARTLTWNYQVIGSISASDITQLFSYHAEQEDMELIGTSSGVNKSNSITFTEFMPFVHLVSPEIKESSEVVMIGRGENKEVTVSFAGTLITEWN